MQTKGHLRGDLWIKKTPSVYSSQQISQWLAKIQYPGTLTSFVPTLGNLALLVRLNQTTFPFEDTPMHYTAEHSMDISYEGLFRRLVGQLDSPGVGSYCFGLNGLFFQMLRGLGFRVFSGSARINEEPAGKPVNFLAFVHMILFMQPVEGSNATYLVDVASGLVRPILLEDGEVVDGCSPSEKHTLVRTAREESSLESYPNCGDSAKLEWRLVSIHTKNDEPPTTRVLYSFIEDEFFAADYESFNYSVLGRRTGLFWENVVCQKLFWMSDEEVREVDSAVDLGELTPLTRYMGRLAMMGGEVRRQVGSRSTVVRVLKTEEDRAAALREIFDIRIEKENLEHVRGRGAELKVA
ncbi:hypothetical protein FB45DRAFT_87961 [Roridomyces roridus]|uniref:Arylamine N-acetyltransferase n=1 Tax=Roridomyces roridus TaxID=1738132 RepID=A0AAD7FKX8_9AGAR|nr:hypothetical protein FB45DRAFT_87961 [Roridomyces roridus]